MELVHILTLNGSKGTKFVVPTKSNGFGKVLEVTKSEVDDLPSFTKGYFRGILAAKGLPIKAIVSQPADTLDCTNTTGMPVYVYDHGEFYEFHCFFATQVETLKTLKWEDIEIFKEV